MIAAVGKNGRIELTGTTLKIIREGFPRRVVHGRGNRDIPINQITAVQYRPARRRFLRRASPGFIQFSFVGGSETRKLFAEPLADENTVMFKRKQQADFDALKTAVDQLRESIQARAAAPAVAPAPAEKPDPIAQLKELAQLRDAGAITDEEFDAKKADLLDRL